VVDDWSRWARSLSGASAPHADWIEYEDRGAGVYRGALLVEDRMSACVFVSPRPDLPSRTWLSGLFAKARIDDADRAGLLVGRPADPRADMGPVVCSCFGVGRKAICDAITRFDLKTTQDVGQRLRAGANCGSCVPEIKALLTDRYWEATRAEAGR
jgi:assimilatory nitrate reductase catalytic subunit